jgi:YggT family protein
VNVFDIIAWVIEAYVVVLVVRALLSWIPMSQGSSLTSFSRAIEVVTEPVLKPVRRVIPPLRAGGMGIDVSFIVVLVGLEIVVYILHRL